MRLANQQLPRLPSRTGGRAGNALSFSGAVD